MTRNLHYRDDVDSACSIICAHDWISKHINELEADFRKHFPYDKARDFVLYCTLCHQSYVERSSRLS